MKLSDKRQRHDRLYHKAKSQGFAARAVYKLEEIDNQFHLFRNGDRVLDLGCWPGSWLQFIEKRVGPGGRIVGLDLKRIDVKLGPNVRVEQGDLLVVEPSRLLGDLPAFDVVVSDAAPHTTGVRSVDQARSEQIFLRALELAESVLRCDGHFVGKIFEGPGVYDLRKRMSQKFQSVHDLHPKGSRAGSTEHYLVGVRFVNNASRIV